MEDIIFVLLELLAELLFQWPFDSALAKREKRAQENDLTLRYGARALISIIAGAVIAWIGALIWPNLWPASTLGRAFLLVGAPLLIGYISYAINSAREKNGRDWLRPWRHAACSALFALAWAITRTLLSS